MARFNCDNGSFPIADAYENHSITFISDIAADITWMAALLYAHRIVG